MSLSQSKDSDILPDFDLSEEGSLNLDEELEVLALLDDGEDELGSFPNCVERPLDKNRTNVQPQDSCQQQYRKEDDSAAIIDPRASLNQQENMIDTNTHQMKHESVENQVRLQYMSTEKSSNAGFEADIAFFDQLAAVQDTAQTIPKESVVSQPSTNVQEKEQFSRSPTSGYGIMEVQTQPNVEDRQVSEQGIYHTEASFAPITYFDPSFQISPPVNIWQPTETSVMQNQMQSIQPWHPYENTMEPSQSPPVLLAQESVSQMVEMYPRQAQGKPPCSLLVMGLGGHSFALYNGKSIVEKSSFLELPAFLKSKNHNCIAPGLMTVSGEEGICIKEPGIEQNLGPFGPSTNRERVLKFLSDQMEMTSTEQHNGNSHHDLCLIWTTLAILARNRGQLTIMSPQGEITDTDVIEMLTVKDSEFSTLHTGAGALPILKDVQSGNYFDQQHLMGQIQQSLSYGKRQDALELAKKGGMWEFALALSHSLGPNIWGKTLEEMTQTLLYDGPLRAHFLLLAGRTSTSFTTSQQNEAEKTLVQGQEYMHVFTPDSDPLLMNWRSTLALLIANRLPGFQEMIKELGDKLWQQRHEVYAAHLCYLLAAVAPQSFINTPDCRLVLLGADHRAHPNNFFTIEALQRTEILEWILMAGKIHRRLPSLVPYKLKFAWMLAEYGKISQAIQYCEVILEVFKSMSGRISKDLNQHKYHTSELLSRLKIHAEIFQITVQRNSTLFKKMGDLLDKGINKLIGVTELEDDISRAPASSEGGFPMSDAYSFKKSASVASLGSSVNGGGGGGSVTFPPQYTHPAPVKQNQSWIQRMLGRSSEYTQSSDPGAMGSVSVDQQDESRRLELEEIKL